MEEESFGRRLRRLMGERGFSRKQLCDVSGISRGTLAGWLADNSARPSERNVEALCQALGVGRVTLLGDLAWETPQQVSRRNVSMSNRRRQALAAVRRGMTQAEAARRFGVEPKTVGRWLRQERAKPRPVTPAPKTVVPEWEQDWLALPTYTDTRCYVCGSTDALEQHHPLPRSQGGKRGPTLTLCKQCHMHVHDRRTLHLRPVVERTSRGLVFGRGAHVEWLETEEACKDFDALSLPGWHRVKSYREGIRPSWARGGGR